jgi:hypothetical protein
LLSGITTEVLQVTENAKVSLTKTSFNIGPYLNEIIFKLKDILNQVEGLIGNMQIRLIRK